MARRSHNETFILLRNNAQKNRSFYKDFNKDDERVKLVSADESEDVFELELSNHSKSFDSSSNDLGFPPWLSSFDEFRYEAYNIKQKIEQLENIQKDFLKQQNNAIFADEAQNEKLKTNEFEIEKRCQELNVLFNRLHSILMHFKTLKTYNATGSRKDYKDDNRSRMLSVILQNIFQFQVREIINLTQHYRSCQRVYMKQRDEATKVDPEFVITFDEDLLQTDLNDYENLIDNSSSKQENHIYFEESTNNYNEIESKKMGNYQKQTQIFLDDQLAVDASINTHLKQRENEMNIIMKSFAELNQIFQEVNTLVVDQGSALDRIDYNLEQVENKVELGAVSLERAHRSISRVRKLKLILGAGLLFFILFLFFIIRS